MKADTGKGGKPRGSRPKRKRKAKLTTQDRIRAATVAALFVAVALAAVFVIGLSLSPEPIAEDAEALRVDVPVAETVPPAETAPLPPPEAVSVPDAPAHEAPLPEAPKSPTKSARQAVPEQSIKSPPVQAPKAVSVSSGFSSPPERHPRPPPKLKGTVVVVIDDVGNNLRELAPFLRLSWPVTVAVLPGLPHSAEAAQRARAAGKEVMLHQPMEALGGQNPGPGAIYTGMKEDEIRAILARNVAEVGPIVGINNHQGSKVTEDERTMKVILSFCRERGLFFLDSRTTAKTVAPAVAAGFGMNVRERDVFLDNIPERAAMIRYLQEGLQKAEKKGSAVMIGHAWSSELASTLQELYPELIEQGFSLSSIARIMMGTYDDEGFGD